VFGAVMLSATMNARAEFYVWRDAHGVKQISNVPPRCLRSQTVSPYCSSLSAAVADPELVAALNQNQRRQEQARRIAVRTQAEARTRDALAAETQAKLAAQRAEEGRQNRIKELHQQLDTAKDAASLVALHGGQISIEMLRRIDTLLAELQTLEGVPAPPPAVNNY
jgi:hypothetical protein